MCSVDYTSCSIEESLGMKLSLSGSKTLYHSYKLLKLGFLLGIFTGRECQALWGGHWPPFSQVPGFSQATLQTAVTCQTGTISWSDWLILVPNNRNYTIPFRNSLHLLQANNFVAFDQFFLTCVGKLALLLGPAQLSFAFVLQVTESWAGTGNEAMDEY